MLLASLIIVREPFVLSTSFIVFCKLACCSTCQLIVKGYVELSFCLQVHCNFTRGFTRGCTRENTFGSLILLPVGEFCSNSCLITFELFLLLFEYFPIIVNLICDNFMLKT